MNKASSSYYQELVSRYFDNSISREELDELLAMVRSGKYDDELTNAFMGQWQAGPSEKAVTHIDWESKLEAMLQQQSTSAVPVRSIRRKTWLRVAAAAMLLLSMGTGIYYVSRTRSNKGAVSPVAMNLANDSITLLPGTSGAVLTLANGDQIELDSAGKGLLAMQGSTKVLSRDGTISYDDASHTSKDILYNTLTTARGRQFHLQLSDGTNVWLNAGSSIRFPITFTGDTRKVAITGEAYFEVAHIERKAGGSKTVPLPFTVAFSTPAGHNGEVQVLGTHFNINAYKDESDVKTTLLEGKVRVAVDGQTSLLSPGQQAAVGLKGDITTNANVDLDAVLAWKNGYFSFSETDLATVMRQVARWYDVEVEYAGPVPSRKFGGEISRNSDVKQVLKIMEESEVHFRIAGRKIIVTP